MIYIRHLESAEMLLPNTVHLQLMRFGLQESIDFISPERIICINVFCACVLPIRWEPSGCFPIYNGRDIVSFN